MFSGRTLNCMCPIRVCIGNPPVAGRRDTRIKAQMFYTCKRVSCVEERWVRPASTATEHMSPAALGRAAAGSQVGPHVAAPEPVGDAVGVALDAVAGKGAQHAGHVSLQKRACVWVETRVDGLRE